MTISRMTGRLAPLVAGLLLAGCSLLGGGKPDQLYRFGGAPTAAASDAGGAVPVARYTLLLMPVRFAAEIEGDRVLASRDRQTLYVKGMRWVAPAPILFTQAVRATLRARAPWIAVTDRHAGGPADHVLQIRIDRFEARYEAGPKAAPTIHVEGEATLGDSRTHGPAADYRLVADQVASGNDAAAIVAAFDQAAANSIVATVDWASLTAAGR